ncbi:MAG: FtsH protease activity modulator HflK [Minwuia sp.]|uniref:FtsH protease activity modulator HflK n=1 Tax=Minwuia sp. TaxID=2493630 RepID=UPI003A89F68E
MPWNSQGGGWQGGGGGNRGPWGQGPSGGGGGGGGPQKPDIEEMIRRGQDRLRQFSPGGGGNRTIIAIVVIIVVGLVAVWQMAYRVQPSQQGVVLRFGEYVRTTGEGLHFKLPAPIETVLLPEVTRVQQTDIGFRRVGPDRKNDIKDESLMLTGDENIVDIDFSVQWIISDAGKYLFEIENAPQTLKVVAESAMREVIGRTPIQAMLTTDKGLIEQEVEELVQATLDGYNAGVDVQGVKLQQVDPPSNVIDAFRDVQRAKADRERKKNEADAYANSIVPVARGDAAKMIEEAEAYKQQKIAEAEGEASRFAAIATEYVGNPEVTSRRLYLETMEEVLRGMDKVIIDDNGGSGVVPYLPLNELGKGRSGRAAQ